MPTPRPVIAGNWKMNGTLAQARALAGGLPASVEGFGGAAIVCPPFPHLPAVVEALQGSDVAVGAQDCHPESSGAHTGSVAAPMLAEIGCRFVIVGHSERRQNLREDDALCAAKVTAAQRAGLTAILCVGETEAEFDAGETLAVLSRQVAGSVPEGVEPERLIVAYEPVWAIGTGRTPGPDDIRAAHAHIKAALAEALAGADVAVLYGGSVKPSNAEGILRIDGVDGALVGGASLKLDDFAAIVRAAPA